MSDKPLDCIGINSATQVVGKHDFRLHAPVVRVYPANEVRAFIARIACDTSLPPQVVVAARELLGKIDGL